MHMSSEFVFPRPSTSGENGRPITFESITINDTTYVVYISDNRLFIVTARYELVQQIDFEAPLQAIAVHQSLQVILIAKGNEIQCLQPNIVPSTVSNDVPLSPAPQSALNHRDDEAKLCHPLWSARQTVLHSAAVQRIVTSSTDLFVSITNDGIHIWSFSRVDSELKELKIEIMKLIPSFGEIGDVQVSPHAKYIASLSSDGRRVLIWYNRPRTNDKNYYDFVYIPHHSPVSYMSWRNYDLSTPECINVLLTFAKDRVCRLWMESADEASFYSFDLAVVINPSQLHYTSLSSTFSENSGDTKLVGRVHWLTGPALTDVVHLRQRAESLSLRGVKRDLGEILDSRGQKLSETLSDYPDLLFCLDQSGSVLIWGVQNLGRVLQRTPKVVLLMKTENTVLPADFDFFEAPIRTLCIHQNLYNSAELSILAQRTSDGVMSLYSMNLDDFFIGQLTAPRFHVLSSYLGPRKCIVEIVRHPSRHLVLCKDETGQCSIFRQSYATKGLRRNHILNPIHLLTSNSPVSCWMPKEPVLLWAKDGKYCFFLMEEFTKGGVRILGHLPDSGPVSDFLFLGSFPSDVESAPCSMILGVTKSNQILIWQATFSNSTLKECILLKTHNLDERFLNRISRVHLSNHLLLNYPHKSDADYEKLCYIIQQSGVVTCFYVMGNKPDNVVSTEQLPPLIEFGSFRIPCEASLIRFGYFDHYAIAVPQLNGGHELQIWSLKINPDGIQPILEWKQSFDEEIHSIDWMFTSDAQHLLCVGWKSRAVAILGQVHGDLKDRKNNTVSWSTLSQVGTWNGSSPVFCSWLHEGGLVVSTSESTLAFSKWLNPKDGEFARNVFTVASAKNGRYPHHHPSLLLEFLFWGNFDHVKYSLSTVYRFVNLVIERGASMKDIPIPLWNIFETLDGRYVDPANKVDSTSLFDTSLSLGSRQPFEMGTFGPEQVRSLKESLSKIHLPHLSVCDELTFLALLDAFVSLEQNDRHVVDGNGVRYLTSFRIWEHLMEMKKNETEPSRKDSYPQTWLNSRDFAFAFYSESQVKLVELVTNSKLGRLMWSDAKDLGLGYWVRDPDAFKRLMDSIARNQYLGKDESSKDPVACSIFYLAMRKKNVLLGLWKLASTHPEQNMMMSFLSNDFEEERWQKAALKNAFALLGKQRYEYAAAFFLLGGKVKDAANVCIKQLNDPQLALVICRLYEGEDSPTRKEIVQTQFLPSAIEQSDRWLLSMYFTLIQDKLNALYSLFMPLSSLGIITEAEANKSDAGYLDPCLLLMYHELITLYKRMIMIEQPNIPPAVERQFFIECARGYERGGCPALAIHVIRQYCHVEAHQSIDIVSASAQTAEQRTGESSSSGHDPATTDGKLEPTSLDWGGPILSQKPQATAADFDWGESLTQTPAETVSGGLDWGEMNSTLDKPSTSEGIDWGEMETTTSNALDFEKELEMFGKQLADPTPDPEVIADTINIRGTAQESEEIDAEGIVGGLVTTSTVSSKRMTAEEYVLYLLNHKRLQEYKWILAMHVVQAVYESATNVAEYRHVLSSEPTFAQYPHHLQRGLKELCDLVGMDESLMYDIIHARCREMDSLLGLLYVNTEENDVQHFAAQMFEREASLLARIGVGRLYRLYGYKMFEVLKPMTERILQALMYSHEKNKSYLPDAVTSQVAVSGYVGLSLSSIHTGEHKRLWWILALSDRYFGSVLKTSGHDELHDMIDQLLQDRDIPDTGDLESPTSDIDTDYRYYDEYGIAKYRKDSIHATLSIELVYILSLRLIGLVLEHYLERLKEVGSLNSEMDLAYGFLSESVLKGFSQLVYDRTLRFRQRLGHVSSFDSESLDAYLIETDIRPILRWLRQHTDIHMLVQATLPVNPISVSGVQEGKESIESSTESANEPHHSEVIHSSKEVIYSMTCNPLDKNVIAIATDKGIHELDVTASHSALLRRKLSKKVSMDDAQFKSSLTPAKKGVIGRNFSFDSVEKAVKRTFQVAKSRRQSVKVEPSDNGSTLSRKVSNVSVLEPHTCLNYYLAGIGERHSETEIRLYQFGQPEELVTYTAAATDGRITRCHFDPFGVRFGAGNTKGDLHLWQFDTASSSLRPSMTLEDCCHKGSLSDFTFLNSSSVLATAGTSTTKMNISVWDTLMPKAKSLVKTFQVGEAGISSLVFCPAYHLLIAGGKKGYIYVVDVRQDLALVDTIQCHDHSIRSLAIDSTSGTLISGSADGEIKLWDIRSLSARDTVTSSFSRGTMEIDGKNKFSSVVSSYRRHHHGFGILELQATGGIMYTCTSDSKIRRGVIGDAPFL